MEISLQEFFDLQPYELDKEQKEKMLSAHLGKLTEYHREYCGLYKKLTDGIGYKKEAINTYYDLPMLPVRLFKKYDFKSVVGEQISKTMTSSGTSGQQVSKIHLDRETSLNQSKTLVKICGDFLGNKRRPMLIIDSQAIIKNRRMFSARGAGIKGFSILGRDVTYALDDDMNLNLEAVLEFVEKHADETILMFGFTFMIWQHFYEELAKRNICLNMKDAVLIHGGGWKKLESVSVDNETFKNELRKVCGNVSVHNYYGMVEQTGSIYMECECGNLHASIFSDIIVRNSKDFSVCGVNEKGIVELVSVLPTSYPGHVLLTEDEGEILGEDDCPCGRKGKYFKIYGRIKNAEVGGCSDTYEKH